MDARATAGRGRAWLVVGAIAAALVVVALAAALIYDSSQSDVIAKGVKVDGVNVGGLHEAAARAKLQRELVPNLQTPVVVHWGSHRWRLDGSQAQVSVDTQKMISEALHASREGSFVSRTFRSLTGASVNHDVPLAITYSHAAVKGLTAQVRSTLDRPPVDATVQPTPSGLDTVPSHSGIAVEGSLGGQVEAALASSGARRSVKVPTHLIAPAVTSSQLAAKYPAYIVVDRAQFRLRFYEHLKLAKTYEIAVGMEGLETPAGLHKVEWKEEDPPWLVPDKAWAGSLAGTTVPPGPEDPLKARFMSFDGGAGIHGIDPSEYSSIGHDASHGCVRMRIPDVIALYSKTPVGTPVYIN